MFLPTCSHPGSLPTEARLSRHKSAVKLEIGASEISMLSVDFSATTGNFQRAEEIKAIQR
jgi:hypothetical protein